MTSISIPILADAVCRVEKMSVDERVRLADEVHERQRNIFYSVLVLKRYGATLEQIKVVLNLLLVCYQAMQLSGKSWPLISEEVQECCLIRITARMRFTEGLTPSQRIQAVHDSLANHPELNLLTHVMGKFQEYGYLGIETETHKMMMLAALNLVECVAETAPK